MKLLKAGGLDNGRNPECYTAATAVADESEDGRPDGSEVSLLETGGPAVPPLVTMQGVRDYACSLCPGLVFRLLEGPGSVKEHLAAVHYPPDRSPSS